MIPGVLTGVATGGKSDETMKQHLRRRRGLTVDQSMIAVLIAAMDANRHVSRDEAARVHHIIWSMQRFRRKSGETVNRLIDTVRERMEDDGTPAVLHDAARTIPPALRQPAFAVAVDTMLSDNRLEREERQFVRRLAAELKIRPAAADRIVRVMLVKNGA